MTGSCGRLRSAALKPTAADGGKSGGALRARRGGGLGGIRSRTRPAPCAAAHLSFRAPALLARCASGAQRWNRRRFVEGNLRVGRNGRRASGRLDLDVASYPRRWDIWTGSRRLHPLDAPRACAFCERGRAAHDRVLAGGSGIGGNYRKLLSRWLQRLGADGVLDAAGRHVSRSRRSLPDDLPPADRPRRAASSAPTAFCSTTCIACGSATERRSSPDA